MLEVFGVDFSGASAVKDTGTCEPKPRKRRCRGDECGMHLSIHPALECLKLWEVSYGSCISISPGAFFAEDNQDPVHGCE